MSEAINRRDSVLARLIRGEVGASWASIRSDLVDAERAVDDIAVAAGKPADRATREFIIAQSASREP